VIVSVFVHQIDGDAHPSVPPGYRWAVHLGGNPHDLRSCLNAGWCPSEQVAGLEGEAVGVAVVKALRMCGVECRYAALRRLDVDPTPVEGSGLDTVSVM
jgi:hypothetical protein